MGTENQPVISFKKVRKVDEILPLRHRILRDGIDIDTARFDGDEASSTWHFAGFAIDEKHNLVGEPVCCVSYMLNQYEHDLAWQLQGMAVDIPYQHKSFEIQMLKITEQCLMSRVVGVRTLWCDVHIMAVPFFQASGWQFASGVFEIQDVEQHCKMVRHSTFPN